MFYSQILDTEILAVRGGSFDISFQLKTKDNLVFTEIPRKDLKRLLEYMKWEFILLVLICEWSYCQSTDLTYWSINVGQNIWETWMRVKAWGSTKQKIVTSFESHVPTYVLHDVTKSYVWMFLTKYLWLPINIRLIWTTNRPYILEHA